MKKVLLTIILNLLVFASLAQTIDDVKIGLGASKLGSGDIIVGKSEGEITSKWHRIFSTSAAFGIGYANKKIFDKTYHRTLLTHLDGNVFISPFGNDRTYNLKLGTGFTLMYVADSYPIVNLYEKRFSLGYSLILENELLIRKEYLLGLKYMIQPYASGDINQTLLIKLGMILH